MSSGKTSTIFKRPVFSGRILLACLLAALTILTIFAGSAGAESITGRVTRDGVNGIAGVTVNAYRAAYLSLPTASAVTDAGGNFTLTVAPGNYGLEFKAAAAGYFNEIYKDQRFPGGGTWLTVSPGGNTALPDNAVLTPCGRISGRVTRDGVNGIAGIQVRVYRENRPFDPVAETDTDTDGNYVAGGLATGNYQVQFGATQKGYYDEWYDNVSSSDTATPVAVTEGAIRGGINATLAGCGSISGTVTDGTSGLAGVQVQIYSQAGFMVAQTETGPGGTYRAGGLATGNYRVYFNAISTGHSTSWYNSKSDFNSAQNIAVTSPSDTPDINVALTRTAAILGRVTSGEAIGIPGVQISVYQQDQSWPTAYSETDDNGYYRLGGLTAGNYQVKFESVGSGFYGEWYQNAQSQEASTPVAVTDGNHTTGIDVVLETIDGGHIYGRVTDPDGRGLAGIQINLFPAESENQIRWSETDLQGYYAIEYLASGSYKVKADIFNSIYAAQWYNGKYSFASADAVQVDTSSGEGRIYRADFQLAEGGRISGRVKDGVSGTPIENVQVQVYEADAEFFWGAPWWAATASDGSFLVTGLPTGNYIVSFNDWNNGYKSEWYLDRSDAATADTVTVTLGATTALGDIELTPAASISGIVTDGSAPVAGVQVYYFDAGDNQSWNSVSTDDDGRFKLPNMEPGTYRLWFYGEGVGCFSEFWENKAVLAEANAVLLENDTQQLVLPRNVVLARGATIKGRVTDASSGEPLTGVEVTVHPVSWGGGAINWWNPVQTDSQGNYTTYIVEDGLTDTNFKVKFSKNGYFSSWYSGKSDFAGADIVTVSAPGTVENINGGLVRGGSITGRVTDQATGSGLSSASVTLYNSAGESILWANTDGQGNYSFTPLISGQYRIGFFLFGYLGEWYNNRTDLSLADTITVTAPETVENINAALSQKGAIGGFVRNQADNTPAAGITVSIYDASQNYVTAIQTSFNGEYLVDNLQPGGYRVHFQTGSSGYLTEWYNDKSDFSTADPVTVIASSTTTVNGYLTYGSNLSGNVTDGTNPLTGVNVYLYSSSGYQLAATQTNAGGNYSFSGLGSDAYRILFMKDGYLYEWYNNQPTIQQADGITVTPPAPVTGIDAVLITPGAIGGTVTDGVGPIAGVRVEVHDLNGYLVSVDYTGTDGTYLDTGLLSGSYRVHFIGEPAGYFNEWYDNATLDTATLVTVTPPATTDNVNAVLDRGASISGQVTAFDTGQPLAGVQVSIYQTDGLLVKTVTTDTNGNYTAGALDSGDYRVFFDGRPAGYLYLWYDAARYQDQSAIITVNPPADRGGVDAVLGRPGAISGRATDKNDIGLAGILVSVRDTRDDSLVSSLATGADGTYTIGNLHSGNYRVFFAGSELNPPYLNQWFNNRIEAVEADTVLVTAPETVANINAIMLRPGSISGQVSNSGGSNLAGVRVDLYNTKGAWMKTTTSGADGTYLLTGINEGLYRVRFDQVNSGYLPRWYNNRNDQATADSILVTPPAETTGINAVLRYPRVTAEVAAGNGTLFPTSQDIFYGAPAEINAIADEGYSYYKYTLNTGDQTPSDSTLKINQVTDDIRITFTFIPVADLQVKSASAPAEVWTGSAFDLTWELENRGLINTDRSWTDYIYLSSDNQVGNDTPLISFNYTAGLNAGASVTRIQTITIPRGMVKTEGTYYLLVVTDIYNNLYEGHTFETGENNNRRFTSQTIQVRVSPMPDLEVTAVNPPSSAFSGQNATFSFTVKNTGNGPTDAALWYDGAYLSLDTQFQSNIDTLLNNPRNGSYLAPGDTYTTTFEGRIPNGFEGDYYLLVATDIYFQVGESLEDNNQGYQVFPITLTAPPNLKVTSVTAPPVAASGQPVEIRWQVKNDGTGNIGSGWWADQVFLSQDTNLDTGDYYLGNLYKSGSLNSKESYEASLMVTLPPGVSGAYYFLVWTDRNNNIYEHASEDDNIGATDQTSNITLVAPDLEVMEVSAPSNATASRPITIRFTVANNGTATTPNWKWTDSVYLSENTVFDTGDRLLGEKFRLSPLTEGDTYLAELTVKLPDAISGIRYLLTWTDSLRQVVELDEENNVWASNPVNIISQPADLVISNVSAPAASDSGRAITVTWKVTNSGTGDTVISDWIDQVFLSRDDQLDTQLDLKLTPFVHNGLLDVGQFYQRSETVELPIHLDGDYRLFVLADASGLVYEGNNEANNRSEPLPIHITRVIPDLQALQLNAPATARSGDTISLDWMVRNNGNGRTDADFCRDAIYLSEDAVLDTAVDTRLAMIHHSGRLDPGASYNGSGTVILPPDASGTFYLFLFTNADNTVTEIERANNGRRAEASTLITLTPAPDLAVTAVSPPESVFSGQPFTLNWTVTNQDAATDTALGWTDSAWLSRDQVLDNTDVYLGAWNRAGGLASGAGYTAELRATVPMGLTGPYYIFVRTDVNNRVYERGRKENNLVHNTQAMQVSLPAPADFIPLADMLFPDTGIAGQTVNIRYRVLNQGVNAFQGSWTDALYLSGDDRWSSDDLLLGRISKNENLLPGQEYTGSFNTLLPGVIPGYYHVIASTDIYNNVLESEEVNNRTASAGRIYVDAELLELDKPDTGFLGYGQSVYYRLNVPVAGETMLLSLESNSTSNPNELYLSFERMPNRGSFDFAYDRPFSPDQEIVVPLTRNGTYYILAHNGTGWENGLYTILARIIPFSLRALDPLEVGNAGPSTLKISGARFTRDTAFRLLDPAGAPLDPTRTLIKDSTVAYTTFDLAGRSPGHYRLLALKAGETAELDSGLVVNPGLGPNLQARINGPSPIRPSREYIFYVDYSNTGDGDAPAPILLVESTTNTPFGFNINELASGQILQILGRGSEDLGGIIRPGEGFGFPLYFRSPDTIQPVEFQVWVITADDTRPIDWTLVEQLIRPAGIPEAEWQAVWNRIKNRIGTTWGDYVLAMGEMANLLSSRGEDASDVRLLFTELFNQESGYPTSRLGGRVINGATGQLMTGATVVARLEISDQSQPDTYISHLATTNAAGEFLFINLPVGTYGLHVDNYRVDPTVSDTMIAVDYNTDSLGLILYAYPITVDTLSPPAPEDDQEVRLTLAADGTPHLVWRRGKSLWHAYRDNGGWTGSPLIDAATGDTLTGYETRLTAAANLFDGAPRTPGLFLAWRRGEGNQSELAYAAGRPKVGGGFEWSAREAITSDSLLDQNPALAVTSDGRIILVFLKSDAAVSDTVNRIRDDTDLYFELINVNPAGLRWPALVRVPLGAPADSPGTVYVPLADAQTFSFAMGIQKETADPLPSIIPIIGGKRCKFWVDGQVTGGASCKAIAAGQLQGEVQLFERVTGSLAAAVSAEWGVDKGSCSYAFNKASISLTAQATGEIPAFYYMVPGDGWFVDKLFELEAGATVTGSISGTAGWEAANFPGLPNTGEVSVSVGIGPYGKAKALDGTLEGTVKGVGSVSIRLLPSCELTGSSLTFAIDLTAGEGRTHWDKTWSWERKPDSPWYRPWSLDQPTISPEMARAAMSLGGRPGLQVIEDDYGILTISTSEPIFSWEEWTGTGTSHGNNSLLPAGVLATDIYEDGPPALTRNEAGEIRLAWTRDVPAGGQDGSQVVTALYRSADNTWEMTGIIPDSLGYNKDVNIIYDSRNLPLAVWSQVDSTGLDASVSADDFYGRLNTGQIRYSTYQAGAWSAPQSGPLALTGNNTRPTLGRTHDNRVIAAWLNRSTSGPARLMAAFWDGNTWSTPIELAAGELAGAPAAGTLGDRTSVFWTQDAEPSETARLFRIYSRDFSGGSWSAPVIFNPEDGGSGQDAGGGRPQPFEIPAAARAAYNQVETDAGGFVGSSFFALPAVPKECCDDDEKNDPPPPPPPPPPRGKPAPPPYTPPVVIPRDPNDIIGPAGFGDERWLTATETLAYTIRFENAADASAPAQEVVITQQMDPDLDWRTFKVGDFGWGDLKIEIPANQAKSFYSRRLDLREDYGFFVDVSAYLDIQTGEAKWTITTIDPDTGEKPIDALVGFLPPKDGNGVGEGFVSYQVKPKRTVRTGDRIDAEARIVFDTENPIDTPPIFNTLDAAAPSSQVNELDGRRLDPNFTVSWNGGDDEGGSGLSGFTIYVSDNNGEYTAWLENTGLTEAVFPGQPGHRYRFYSIARDNAGNLENEPRHALGGIAPDAVTRVLDPDAIHVITVTSGPNGQIDPAGPAVNVNEGRDAVFNITPDEGYHIESVTVDSQPVGAISSYTFTEVVEAHSIGATFAINTYNITVGFNAGGRVEPAGPVVKEYGSSQSFTIIPDPGYRIDSVMADTDTLGAVTGYTFENIRADHHLQVEFAPVPILSVAPGSIEMAPGQNNAGLTITNTGLGTLLWSLAENLDWLAADTDSGALSAGQSRMVTLLRSGGNRGDSGTLTVSNVSPGNEQEAIAVNLRINDRPARPGSVQLNYLPDLTAVDTGSVAVDTPIVITGPAFNGADPGDQLAAGRVELWRQGGDIVFGDTVTAAEPATAAFSRNLLRPGRNYLLRLRYQDNLGAWSDWSEWFTLTTVPAAATLDGDDDGVADLQEVSPAELDQAGLSEYIGLDTGRVIKVNGRLLIIRTDPPRRISYAGAFLPAEPPDYGLTPYGVLIIRVDATSGDTGVGIRYTFDSELGAGDRWLGYLDTAAAGGHWNEIGAIAVQGADLAAWITDGGGYDADRTANLVTLNLAGLQIPGEPGDLNGDRRLDQSDLQLLLKMITEKPVTIRGMEYLSPYPEWLNDLADLDRDGAVTISDNLRLYRRLIGTD